MKILITDGFEKEGIEYFSKEGFEVDLKKPSSPEELISWIPYYDALIVRSATKVKKEIIEAGAKGKLKMIGRAGVGVDNVDVKAATDLGKIVKFAPHGGTTSVAEFAVALASGASRYIPQSYSSLKQGIWKKKQYQGFEMKKKTAGIIGCGRIGKTTASILEGGFKMEILGYDPYAKQDNLSFKLASKDELLEKSDYIILHAPKQPCPILALEEFKKMAKKPYIIDVSRGGNILEDALQYALKDGLIKGAALDVWPQGDGKEGQEFKSRLFEFENFIGTSHLGASTTEGQVKTSIEMAEVTVNYLLNGDLTNAVNAGEGKYIEKKRTYNLFVTHENMPGMFGKVSDAFGKYNINLLSPEPADLFYDWKSPTTKTTTCFRATQPLSDEIIEEIKKIDKVYSAQD
jgi:D-3-phosphoglycerate dehydrogenase